MKAKVLERFRDKNTGELYEVGATINVTEERFAEINETAKAYGSKFVEEVKPKTSPRRGKRTEQ